MVRDFDIFAITCYYAGMRSRINVFSKVRPEIGISYLIDTQLSARKLKHCVVLLVNPLIETTKKPSGFKFVVEIGFLPGVTDNVGNTATEMLGYKTYSVQVFLLQKNPEAFARDHYNPLIQRYAINTHLPMPKVILPKAREASSINLNITDDELMPLSRSRTLALDLPSMKTIQAHFKKLGRSPTDVELEALAQTWSEHCKHTIFADPLDEIKDGLYKRYIKGATEKIKAQNPNVKKFLASVFTDNSGAIVFDNKYLVTHKVETHNSPSALDPFGGAITGIVGVNRDALGFGLGAKPIVNVYGYCFSHPEDSRELFLDRERTRPLLPTRRIMDGVIAGVNSGGNCSGIPTPQGFLYFDKRYRGKPLVFCGTVGLIPRKVKDKPSHIKRAIAGDHIVLIGGRVGLDGIHGATFASESTSVHSPATAVQIGDPITQKKFSDAIAKEARDLGLYHSITDTGGGGISSSVGEMARESGGCEVNLDCHPVKYPGIEPWQIWVSESQERMILAVPPKNWEKFADLMHRRGVEATIIGKFTKSGRCVLKYHGKTVMDLEMDFLHNGRPIKIQKSQAPSTNSPTNIKSNIPNTKWELLKLLAEPNIASYEFISQQYDHTVQGTAVIGPLQGPGRINGNASVTAPVLGSKRGIVLTQALKPELSEINPYAMATTAIDTAIRNVVAAGADPDYLALIDNFCWCSSNDPERLWQLKEAVRGCYDTAVAYGTPFISGKDSMFNDFSGYDAHGKPIKISVPPTLLISAIGVIPDVTKTVTEDLKTPGDLIYILSGETAQLKLGLYRAFYKAVQKNLIASAISIGRGSVPVALAKTAMAGMLGIDIKLPATKLAGGLIVSISPENKKAFENAMQETKFKYIGVVIEKPEILIKFKQDAIKLSIKEALQAYRSTFKNF